MVRTAEGWKKFLADVSAHHEFIYANKHRVRNVIGLLETISDGSEADYKMHVVKGKNAIAVWIADVLGDEELALQLSKVSTKTKAKALISRRITEAVSHVSHTQLPTWHHDEKFARLSSQIAHLEKDMEHLLGHNTKTVLHKRNADHRSLKTSPGYLKLDVQEFALGLTIGILVVILLNYILGVVL